MSRTRRQIVAVCVFIIVVVFFSTTFRMAVVQGDSMLPTYHDGQVLLVNRLNLFSGPIKKGDVVLINRNGKETLIKRVAYLPGEVIRGTDILPFLQVQMKFEDATNRKARRYWERVGLRVPDEHVVVLGDNRRISEDSRQFGPVPLTDVIGRVVNAPPRP